MTEEARQYGTQHILETRLSGNYPQLYWKKQSCNIL